MLQPMVSYKLLIDVSLKAVEVKFLTVGDPIPSVLSIPYDCENQIPWNLNQKQLKQVQSVADEISNFLHARLVGGR